LNEDIRTKGEYFIADAMGIMLEDGLKLFPKVVNVWLDAGLPGTVLSTNRYLLDHGRDNSAKIPKREGVRIHPPVHIHPSAEIVDSTIGPHVSIGPECMVTGSKITDSVLDIGAQVIDADLNGSLIGARAKIEGVAGIINVGDDSEVMGNG
jgi:glucose-1-phosphate thymidylyltransferase